MVRLVVFLLVASGIRLGGNSSSEKFEFLSAAAEVQPFLAKHLLQTTKLKSKRNEFVWIKKGRQYDVIDRCIHIICYNLLLID